MGNTVSELTQRGDTDDTLVISELKTADYSKGVGEAPGVELCDLVMKGGVTSGVVYPTTMCRLAQKFRFKSIGGTSAGALAAALAAAAEYQRQNNPAEPSTGFRRLAEIPEYLGSGTNLRDLFQPSPETKPLFRLGLSWIQWSSIPRSVFLALGVYLRETITAAVAALAVSAALCWVIHFIEAACTDPEAGRRQLILVLAYLSAAIVGVLVFVVAAGWLIGRRLFVGVQSDIPNNHFGLCTGLRTPSPNSPTPLTPWLADQIDYVAGRTPIKSQGPASKLDPLTFGDLYGPEDLAKAIYPQGLSAVLDTLNAQDLRDVNLEMVTTDVTAGRPYRLPFDSGDPVQFFYDPVELQEFFPSRVLSRMASKNASRSITFVADPKTGATMSANVLPFPEAGDLPVIVAARMSMSFPFLFSAVPLFAADRDACTQWKNGGAMPAFRKTWFSDGGLSSNIPIHFFDGPLPRRPTFALNLRGFPTTADGYGRQLPQNPTNVDKVFLATTYDPDVETFNQSGDKRMFQFVNSMLDAMRNWNDNTLMQLPSYRERTVEIAMTDQEGGLNLTMPQDTLQSIMQRGFIAADLFDKAFGTPDLATNPNWNNHRFIRMRAALLMQSEWTRRFAPVWTDLTKPTFPTINMSVPANVQPYSLPEQAAALAFGDHLADAPNCIGSAVTLSKSPNPPPELRARPRV